MADTAAPATRPDGYYDPDSPHYWKLAQAKRGHTTRSTRIYAPGDTYEVCTTCSQQVNIACDGRHDCDAALLIRENERLRTALARAHNEGLHGVGCRGWDGQEMDPNRCTCWRSDVRAALAKEAR